MPGHQVRWNTLTSKNPDFAYNYILYLVENKRYGEAKQILYDLLTYNPKAIEHSEIKKMSDYLKQLLRKKMFL